MLSVTSTVICQKFGSRIELTTTVENGIDRNALLEQCDSAILRGKVKRRDA